MAKSWWELDKDTYLLTMSYYFALLESAKEKLYSHFFDDYKKTMLTKFIFESNTIELEGLSEGETRKLLFESANVSELRKTVDNTLSEMKGDIDYEIIINKIGNPEVVLMYNRRKKQFPVVFNHYIALLYLEYKSLSYYNKILRHETKKLKKLNQAYMSVISPSMKQLDDIEKLKLFIHVKKVEQECESASKIDTIISEFLIKGIHKRLSLGLPNNDNGKPGKYRPKGACIISNQEITFFEPSLIPSAMKTLIIKHKQRFMNKDIYNPVLEACQISADIVRIHPFGDYNGRTSRLLLNTLLWMEGFPINLILRADKPQRSKYFTSMKHYVKGRKLEAYITLVCKTILEHIETINHKLVDAGVPIIKPIELNDDKVKNLLSQLDFYCERKR